MAHIIDVTGPVIKKTYRKTVLGKRTRYAVVNDGYINFLIEDRGYVVGQHVRFYGQIVDVEKRGLVRLMGQPLPLKD